MNLECLLDWRRCLWRAGVVGRCELFLLGSFRIAHVSFDGSRFNSQVFLVVTLYSWALAGRILLVAALNLKFGAELALVSARSC